MLLRVAACSLAFVASARPTTARADEGSGWLCVYPHPDPFSECSKGTSSSERAAEDCLQRQARRKARRPRFRLGAGAWVDFPDRHWRCVPLPSDQPVRVTIENYGANFKSWKEVLPASCASHILDLTRQNWYGALNTRCSREKRTDDERLSDYTMATTAP